MLRIINNLLTNFTDTMLPTVTLVGGCLIQSPKLVFHGAVSNTTGGNNEITLLVRSSGDGPGSNSAA